tara:strand:- start:1856 stop:3634 length:1779 start_codon:yes stop_codon:yes gene_type:complete
MLNKLSKLLPAKYHAHVFILGFLYFLLSLMEIIGIGSIPVFLSAVIDEDYLRSKLLDIKYLNDLKILNSVSLINYFLFFILGIFFLKFIFQILLFFYEAKFFKNIRFYLSSNVFSKFILEDYKNYYNYNSSEIIRITLSDTERSLTFIRSIFTVLKDFLMITVIITGLLLVDFKLTLLIFLLLAGSSFIFYIFYRPLYLNYGKTSQLDRQFLNRITYESIGSIKNIKISGLENLQIKKFIKTLISLSERIKKIEIITKLPKPFFELLIICFFALILIFFKSSNSFSTDLIFKLTFVSLAIARMLPLIISLTSQFNSINNVEFSVKSTSYALNQLNELYKNQKGTESSLNKPISKFDSIDLDNVNFKYDGNENNTIKNVNINVTKGKIVGITGPSGSGKSTLVDLIIGLIEPTTGQVKINHQPIRELKKDWLNLIGYIPQEVHLNDETLKNNITFLSKKNFDKKKLYESIKMSGLESLISSNPKILDERVGEKGIKLSGGEKQRVGIARALYKDSKILILDEPTSSLDEDIESKILENIFRLKGLTLIMVTHKIYTLKKCDEILFLSNGKVVFQGPYKELIKFVVDNYKSLNI